ncbi:MAG: hypothetical protein ACREEN_00535 [Stellaceae bacterium]
MPSIKITLAGVEYPVDQLTLGQIEDLSVAALLPDDPDPQANVRRGFQRARETIAAALSKTAPDMTAEKLRDLVVTREEFNAAYRKVLEFSGLLPRDAEKALQPGEVAAGAS